jgi:hypothetical protein
MTVSAELAAKSRGDIPPAQRGISMLLLDEFAQFVSHSHDAFSHMLEETRKYGLFVGLIHQHWRQIPLQLRGALRNCGIEVVFRLERPDAAISFDLLHFPYHPYLRKRMPSHSFRSSTPRYFSRPEQEAWYIDAIIHLAKREAFVKLPGDRIYQMQTLTVNDPAIDPFQLKEIENEYLTRYFRSQSTNKSTFLHHSQPLLSSFVNPDDTMILDANDSISPNSPTNDRDEDDYDEFRDEG